MTKIRLIILIAWFVPTAVWAQNLDFRFENSEMLMESKFGILSNTITNMSLSGDSLWVGPFLNLTIDGGVNWLITDTDSLFGTSNRTFSLDRDGDVIAVGLGRVDASAGDVQTAAGFLISLDAGRSFEFRFPQLDQPADSSVQYGVSTLSALAIIVPQQSPPFDINYDSDRGELLVAGWASGLRRSADMGKTWSRVVLPPDDLNFITPDSSYDFIVAPRRGGTGSFNHMGFSVLSDSKGRIWAGTAGGLNRSLDGGHTWQKFVSDGTSGSLVGNWVISIEEQIIGTESIVWTANWSTGETAGERFGVTYSSDGGESFRQALQGERIYDFAFSGSTVYAAGDNGLFVSEDGGQFWISIRDFRTVEQTSLIPRDESIFSVVAAGDLIWAGTGSGLLKSTDRGLNWTLNRVDVPLKSDIPDDRIPSVSTFAYPNPFSPAADGFVRIKYELTKADLVEIRIFDFGMNLVKTLPWGSGIGTNEARWDGMSDRGIRVANGVYFYEVRSDGRGFRGKILVIE